MKSYNKYLKEVFDKKPTPELTLDDISIELPFVYKERGLYLNGNRIGNFNSPNDLVIDKNAVDEYMNFDNCVNYFSDNTELTENEVHMIDIDSVDIYDIKTESESDMDSSGDEYSVSDVTSYEVYYDRFPIKNILKKEDVKKITRSIDEIISNNTTRRYIGTHRTY